MKKLFVSCIALSVLLLGVNSANALTFLNDWYLDIDGPGLTYDPEFVSELINTVGYGYIENTFPVLPSDGGTDFSFSEEAVFISTSSDSSVGGLWSFSGDYEFTAYFYDVTGTGSLSGGLSFDTGTLDLYSDPDPNYSSLDNFFGANDGTKIATFSLLSGTGAVDASGVPNGQITVILEATEMLPGYFFDSDMNDLSLIDPIQWVLGFATTNASWQENYPENVGIEFGVGANLPPFDLVVSSNGQYRLAVVPEPSTFLLLGGGLLGLGFLGYRRKLRK